MENKIVLITGSTDGIGKQTALELAVRLKRTNVTANCLHPGVIDTKMLPRPFDCFYFYLLSPKYFDHFPGEHLPLVG